MLPKATVLPRWAKPVLRPLWTLRQFVPAQAHLKPDFVLSFKDDEYAIKTLSKASPMAFMKGMQAGDIKMEGDFGLLMWFNNAAKFLQPDVPRPVRQALKWAKARKNAVTA